MHLHPNTLRRLSEYHWPGNIRELDHAMERAVILCDGAELLPDDFYFAAVPEIPRTSSEDALNTLANADYTLEALEKMMVQKALVKHSGNITHAAKY